MDIVYALCEEDGNCLCAPWDILQQFTPKDNFDEEKLERILQDLQSDGYLDVIRSDRKGELTYVITLRANGFSYRRESLQVKRNIYFKVLLTVGGAVASFLIGLLLRALFS